VLISLIYLCWTVQSQDVEVGLHASPPQPRVALECLSLRILRVATAQSKDSVITFVPDGGGDSVISFIPGQIQPIAGGNAFTPHLRLSTRALGLAMSLLYSKLITCDELNCQYFCTYFRSCSFPSTTFGPCNGTAVWLSLQELLTVCK
jgi:hypothetical protein